ncbi:hypothetical protein SO802_006144 [Lithocarpus litseifolius]|uniref:DUF4283 domain-containing protein n=1 Tax=Lithocarpus litseifolius TaxID=425828 RepID=A0AAW2DKT8_9ROSI
MEVIIRTFSPLWRVRNGFKVREAGDHIRLFVFDNAKEVDKIMASEPLSFDKHLVDLHRLANAIPVQEVAFNTVSVWVQIHDISVSFLNKEVAEDLCEAVGVVDRSSKDDEMDGGSYIRVRVRVDILVPLCRGRVLSIEDEEELWVSFKMSSLVAKKATPPSWEVRVKDSHENLRMEKETKVAEVQIAETFNQGWREGGQDWVSWGVPNNKHEALNTSP